MRALPIRKYVRFGTGFRYLQDVQPGYHVHGQGKVLRNIELFFEFLQEFGLVVTRRAAADLRKMREELANTAPDHRLSLAESKKVSDIIRGIRPTLMAEAAGLVAFIVTEKRWDADKLLFRIRALFAPKVIEALSGIAQYDFSEAGKCIAFERPTAAAFHLLRGTEEVLRWFYRIVVRRGRVDLMWGPMIADMRKRRNPPPLVLLDNLDNIRRSFRNPTQHPDKIYDIHEAQDLFGLCVEVVNRMVVAATTR